VTSWQDIVGEVHSRQNEDAQDYVLKKYLKKLNRHTNRAAILCASALADSHAPPRAMQLIREDSGCFAAASSGFEERELDLILHSPGGSVEAAEQIVLYLRRRYDHIRVIVPLCASSTAALLACAADEILLSESAALGPIDPIVSWFHHGAAYSSIAQDVVNEYSIAQRSINNKKNDPALWTEKLKAFAPGLLAACKSQQQTGQSLATEWLTRYMFQGEESASERAEAISAWLSDSRRFGGGSRSIGQAEAASHGLKASLLEEDESLSEIVMAVFYAALVKFRSGDCIKIIESHRGKGCTHWRTPTEGSA
jgi:hypothetical protein